ncbi:unnamed protein product [Vitrella brassicaformis CCMP3155]|uniref:Alpha/beta hydrolase fold-5 domain-containing protein n=1 Tax=Vitrella brassicaformis (strain CCMP3155) TaxID=1169540 RepID=A0A0G4E9N3_VITBC|nr:unnamed protein product [Vitrella brassicaformis CCMP3155]|mmetsp:Transcript_52094/g.130879  ORF Transcript_52094/g.130879 Transcript_52094/m.130879 type:complete len:546 (-) Transcript_52094:420-2057(-)|eukprot:CEL92138.1 unnamed protein product [Vitrella brassicaformis CCMP3155]
MPRFIQNSGLWALLIAHAASQVSDPICRPIEAVRPYLESTESINVTDTAGTLTFQGRTAAANESLRGLLIFPDPAIDSWALAPLAHQLVTELVMGGGFLRNALVIVPSCSTCVWDLLEEMEKHEVAFWGVLGQGKGVRTAVQFALNFHPKVKGLVVLGGVPEDQRKTLREKNILVQVFGGESDETVPLSAIQASLSHYPINPLVKLLPNVTHADLAWHELPCPPPSVPNTHDDSFAPNARLDERQRLVDALIGSSNDSFTDRPLQLVLGGLHYPAVEHQGKQYLRSGDGVQVETDEKRGWIVFRGGGGGGDRKPYRAGIVFYVGAYVPTEAYAGLLRPLAARGYLIVALISPINLSPISPVDQGGTVLEKFGNETTDWFAMGHSAGGYAVGAFCEAFSDMATPSSVPRVRGGVLVAGSLGAVGTANFTRLAEEGSEGAARLRFLLVVGSRDFLREGDDEVDIAIRTIDERFLSANIIPRGNFAWHIVEGGNHDQWGFYGEQSFPPGFERASICRSAQIAEGVREMNYWIREVLDESREGRPELSV